jgi:hypothetical protein
MNKKGPEVCSHGTCTRPPALGFKTCERCLQQARAHYAKDPHRYDDKQRAYALMTRYKLTIERWEEIFNNQNRRCANIACSHPRSTILSDWYVDHDHSCCSGITTCGKCVRGILCRKCNLALGYLNDSIDSLYALIDYLKRTNHGRF